MPASERLTLSTSATWSAIERFRCRTPIPPRRASAIAIRPSVTVDSAAERSGISSATERVRRVAVETSFGSTPDSAGTSRTSSKVSPSLANLSSRSLKWSDPSGPPGGRTRFPRSGDGLELVHLDPGREAPRLRRIEAARTDLEHRRAAGRDREAKRVLDRGRTGIEDGREPLGEERVARPDDGDRLEALDVDPEPPDPAILPDEGEATVLHRHLDVSGAELRDRLERHHEVLLVVQLLSDELLRLMLVGRHEPRLRLEPEPERLAVRVEDDTDVAAVELTRRVGVEPVGDAARKGPGEDDGVGTAGQVAELVHQCLELAVGDLRAPLVDLRLLARRRVDDEGRRPGLVADADEVVEDRLPRQLLDDPRAGAPAREPGRDDRDVEPLERAGDVEPLPAGKRQHLARPMALAELQRGNGE